MKLYLRILSVLYFVGFALHVADLFDFRLELSQMSLVWKFWVWYLCAFDLVAAIGLWRSTRWGQATFLLIAGSQLIAYLGFKSVFGQQTELVWFHIVTLTIYLGLSAVKRKSVIEAHR